MRQWKGLQAFGDKWYYLDQDGKMTTEPVALTPDKSGEFDIRRRWSRYIMNVYIIR
ncbi:MAG: hypothetical protein LBQ71_20620 [Hungatella sp.]|jgi:hypothetical protein|nr:hypothetical protein [Hungatella sp.]